MAYQHANIGGVDEGVGVGSTGGGGGHGAEYSGDEHESRSGGEEPLIDSDFNDKPIYLLEHLATFTVNKQSGIIYPADGMRRLLQLEKTTGIWSQKMQLCLDGQWLLIMDYETGNIIERFPASLIQEPTAFTSNDAMELYNNILVLIVSGGSGARSEMHIFQSQSVSAVHLVEDLKNLRSGKLVTQQRECFVGGGVASNAVSKPLIKNTREQQQQQTYQQHHRTSFEQFGMHELSHGGAGSGSIGIGKIETETDSELGGINDENSSTSSDKYERDVTVLNHCFDDIEKFIARLQHAAAATRELERRRRNRKSKKKDPGEGLLTLRTRPPHEKEFIDIFAKFKLSFNLLAKLKTHIHDPNAPELVHFLFTPLALIVEASSDTYYEGQLPAHVINPLLTREAINLLVNCVTSKETELWRSLGDAWIVPRDQWKEDVVGSYHPVFLDGWSPDYLVIDQLESSTAQPTTPPLKTTTSLISKRRSEMHLPQTQLQQHHQHHQSMIGADISATAACVGSAVCVANSSANYDEYDVSPLMLNEKYTMHGQQQQQQQHESSVSERATSDCNAGGKTDTAVAAVNLAMRGDLFNDGGIANEHSSSGTNLHHSQNTDGLLLLQSITSGLQNLNTTRKRIGGGGSSSAMAAFENQRRINNIGGGMAETPLVAYTNINNNNINTNNNGDDGGNRLLETWIEELQASGAKIVLVTYPRTANNDKELSVVRGEYLEILDDTRKWWKARNMRGQVAHVPHTIVTSYNYGGDSVIAGSSSKYYGHHSQPATNSSSYKGRHLAGATNTTAVK